MFTQSALCGKASIWPDSSPYLLRAVLLGLLEILSPELELLKIPKEQNKILNFQVMHIF